MSSFQNTLNESISIGPGQSASVPTVDGKRSFLQISNSPKSTNTLTFAIDGLPETVKASLDGKVLSSPNGVFNIPADRPNMFYLAKGDFEGLGIEVANLTKPAIPAIAVVTTGPLS